MVKRSLQASPTGIQQAKRAFAIKDWTQENLAGDVNLKTRQPIWRFFTEIAELQNLKPTEFDRVGLGAIEQKKIPGMQAVKTYSKLRVLGRPGVGKTTFLQHLAIQCNGGAFAADQVPIFIMMRDFAEESRNSKTFSLFDYICSRLSDVAPAVHCD
ncbi:NACHT domain-containing protein [Leptolyngbya sp. AN03gr2]|uniref:NACHT domain-containing protein n=1 Tax=unclassified Leptolyngbya TaxID=2650499 RepID=UPI003D3183D5